MAMNTLRTILGFIVTLINKYTPLKFSKNNLEGIYNYHLVNQGITTSGQPTEKQFLLMKEAGYKTVINLAPHNAENSLPDEALLLSQLGLKYIHIPVNFKHPSSKDFQKFVTSMNTSDLEETWVHCAANMRVSAFVYKYRCEILNVEPVTAKEDLAKIWEPLGVWKKFILKD